MVKWMKLGSFLGLILCRNEDAPVCDARASAWMHEQRGRALGAYAARDENSHTERDLSNAFLAIADFVSDIALAWHRSGQPDLTLWGRGIFAYHVWRMLGVNFPHIAVSAFVTDVSGSSVLHVIRPSEAAALYPRQLRVRISDEPSFAGMSFDFDLCGVAPEAAGVSPSWRYQFASGDHDQTLPQSIAGTYFSGAMSLLGQLTPDLESREFEFEKRFKEAFPHGFQGV